MIENGMTKKYAAVHPPLITRLQAEAEKSHKKSPDAIKAVKTKLHMLYGAYTQNNAHKKAAAIISALEESIQVKKANALEGVACSLATELLESYGCVAKTLLSLHASTSERLPHYTEFYDFMLKHTGPVGSVLDVGCGYNPFSIPLIPGDIPQAYYAYDIDTKVAELLNRFFKQFGLPQQAKCADLASFIPQEQADIGLLCKLLPVLEAQITGSGFALASGLNVCHLLITYPLKSLGGREKGMAKHYTESFEAALAEGKLGKFSPVAKDIIGDEMLFLLVA